MHNVFPRFSNAVLGFLYPCLFLFLSFFLVSTCLGGLIESFYFPLLGVEALIETPFYRVLRTIVYCCCTPLVFGVLSHLCLVLERKVVFLPNPRFLLDFSPLPVWMADVLRLSWRRMALLTRYRALLAYLCRQRASLFSRPTLHGDFRWRDLQRRYSGRPRLGSVWALDDKDFAKFLKDYDSPPMVMFDRWKARIPPDNLVPLIVRGRVAVQAVALRRNVVPELHGAASDVLALIRVLIDQFELDYADETARNFTSFLYEVLRLYYNTDMTSRVLTVGALLAHPMVRSMAVENIQPILDRIEKLVGDPLSFSEVNPLEEENEPSIHANIADVELPDVEKLYSFNTVIGGAKASPIIVSLLSLCAAFWQTTAYRQLGISKKQYVDWCAEIASGLVSDAGFIARFLEFLVQLVKRIRVAWASGDPYDLLGSSAFMIWTNEVAAEKVKVDGLRLKMLPYDLDEGLARIVKLRVAGDKFMQENRACSYYYTNVLAMEKTVRGMLGTVREEPLGFIIRGPPGCGKTTMVTTIENIVRRRYNLTKGNITHYYTENTTHQQVEGIPAMVVWNDCLTTKDDKSVTPTLDFLQQLVDIAPIRFNGASLEDKANSSVEPRAVVLTTNQATYQFSNSVAGANKLDRRYLVVRIQYTAAAKAAAKKLSVDVSRLLTVSPSIDETWLTWSVGWMKSGNGTQIQIRPVADLHVFTTFESVVAYLNFKFEEHDVRLKMKREAKLAKACINGIQTPHDCTRCVPYEKKDPVVAPAQDEEDDLELHGQFEEAMYNSSLPRWFEYLGSVFEVPLMVPRFFLDGLRSEKCLDYVTGATLATSCYLGAWWLAPTYWFWKGVGTYYSDRFGFTESSPVGFFSHVCLVMGLACAWSPITATAVVCSISRDTWRMYGSHTFSLLAYYYDTYCISCAPITWAIMRCAEFAGLRLKNFKHWKVLGAALLGLVAILLAIRTTMKLHGSILGRPVGVDDPPVAPVYPAPGFGVRTFTDASPVRVKVSRPGVTMHGTLLSKDAVVVPRHFLFPMPSATPVEEMKAGAEWVLSYEGVVYPQRYDPSLLSSTSASTDFVVVRLLNFTKCPYPSVVMASIEPGDALFAGNVGVVLGEKCRDYPYNYLTSLLPFYKEGDCGTPLCNARGHLVAIYTGKWGQVSIVQVLPPDLLSLVPTVHGLAAPTYSRVLPFEPPQPGLHPKSDAAWMMKRNPETVPFPVIGHEVGRRTPAFTGAPALGAHAFMDGLSEEYVSPLVKAEKFGEKWVSLTTRKFEAAADTKGNYDPVRMEKIIDAYVARFPPPSAPVGFLTLHQVVVGCRESAYVSGRDPTKAAGPGLAREGVFARKAIDQVSPERYQTSPELLRALKRYDDTVASGIVPMVEGKCVIKDELIPASKRQKGGGRYFTVIDLAANLQLKMAMGNIISYILQHPSRSFCFGGINAGSGAQWGFLQRFLSDGKRGLVLTADHSTFDTRHNVVRHAVHAVFDRLAAKLGYSTEMRKKLAIILESFFWMLLEVEGNYYISELMLASGRADTVIYNSVVNVLVFGYAYDAYLLSLGEDVDDVFNDLILAVLGDDSCATVPTEHQAEFPAFLVEVGAQLGYKITSATNKDLLPVFISFSEATFLKRTFRHEDDSWFAPLALESIFKMMCYTVDLNVPAVERLCSAALSAQRESFLHGRDVYDDIQRRLDLVEEIDRVVIPRLSFDDLHHEFRCELLRMW